MTLPVVKICCISSIAEARLAMSAGASAIGLVSAMPSGPGVIPEERIAKIAAAVPPPVETFLLTCRFDADSIVVQHRLCRTTTLQLVDKVSHGELQKLRRCLPGIKLVQVVHVIDADSIREARSVAPYVDSLLLDSGNPAAAVKELGGTGRTHNWRLSRHIRDSVRIPVFLAGGLRPDNLSRAIASVAPYGLDVCSGVRTAGRLNGAKLRAFFAGVAASGDP